MITITELTALQIPAAAALERLCFSDPWSEVSLRSELQNPLALWLAAMDGDRLTGYVGAQTVPPEADMMNLAVAPDCRRRGIGEALVRELLRRLDAQGIRSLSLEVRVSNESAQALYRKLGFAPVGRRPRYYEKPREDALILRKEWETDEDFGQ